MDGRHWPGCYGSSVAVATRTAGAAACLFRRLPHLIPLTRPSLLQQHSFFPSTQNRAIMSETQQTTSTDAPWHAKYPAPKHVPGGIPREEVLAMLKNPEQMAGRDYVLVDVRRNDFEGGTIRGSVNLPAQSLYPTRAALFQMVKAAGISKVIFYCGSCNGRGPRAAGWFGDYMDEQQYDGAQSLILTGGIKGWAKAGAEFVELMDEYDASVWSQ